MTDYQTENLILHYVTEEDLPEVARTWPSDHHPLSVKEAREAIAVMGGKLLTSERFLVPESDLGRTLVVVKKERPTDNKYPRGGGKPMKNPIVSRET